MTAAVVSLWFSVPCTAQELYRVMVNTISVATNASGGLSYTGFGNRDLIQHCAEAHGITNLMDLKLVYNRTADALEVVSGTNHTLVCTPMSFAEGVSLSKTNNRVRERLAYVFLENSTTANGSLRARESYTFGTSNTVTGFTLSGQLQFAQAAQGTNAARIYSGRIFAGSFLRDEDEDDRDEDHDWH